MATLGAVPNTHLRLVVLTFCLTLVLLRPREPKLMNHDRVHLILTGSKLFELKLGRPPGGSHWPEPEIERACMHESSGTLRLASSLGALLVIAESQEIGGAIFAVGRLTFWLFSTGSVCRVRSVGCAGFQHKRKLHVSSLAIAQSYDLGGIVVLVRIWHLWRIRTEFPDLGGFSEFV